MREQSFVMSVFYGRRKPGQTVHSHRILRDERWAAASALSHKIGIIPLIYSFCVNTVNWFGARGSGLGLLGTVSTGAAADRWSVGSTYRRMRTYWRYYQYLSSVLAVPSNRVTGHKKYRYFLYDELFHRLGLGIPVICKHQSRHLPSICLSVCLPVLSGRSSVPLHRPVAVIAQYKVRYSSTVRTAYGCTCFSILLKIKI